MVCLPLRLHTVEREVRRDMKHPFGSFAVRYLTALLLGLLLLLLHGPVQGGPFAVFVPQIPSPWELSKLIFWPMLVAGAVYRRGEGGCRLPGTVLTSLAMVLVSWGVQALSGAGLPCLAVWVVLAAAGTAFAPDCERHRCAFAVLAAVLSGAYLLLTFWPLPWGPFADPRGAAALAAIVR